MIMPLPVIHFNKPYYSDCGIWGQLCSYFSIVFCFRRAQKKIKINKIKTQYIYKFVNVAALSCDCWILISTPEIWFQLPSQTAKGDLNIPRTRNIICLPFKLCMNTTWSMIISEKDHPHACIMPLYMHGMCLHQSQSCISWWKHICHLEWVKGTSGAIN